MQIIWTQEALEQLIDIEDYIARGNPERAAKFVEQLVEQAESLPGNPRVGRVVPEIANPDIRELIFNKYRIVYRSNEKHIEILIIFEEHELLRITD
jgi:toxin ParE1/3/4